MKTGRYIFGCLMVLCLLCPALPGDAFAQVGTPSSVCTDQPQFSTDVPKDGSGNSLGLVSGIAKTVQDILNTISQQMFQKIESDSSFTGAVGAVITLYIAIYGILFALGMVQVTVYDFTVRLVKITLVGLLASGNAWSMFNQYVVTFFQTGTDDIINEVTKIAIGGVSGTGGPPLAVLDQAIAKAISAKMAVHLIATVFTSPYGFVHAILMGIALMSFIGSLLTGIWVYLMSMVLRALLFGIAPIFLACMLFERTKHLFTGWLNQVINACLQPILLFTFLAFFIKLIESTIDNILKIPVCWTEASDAMRGTPFNFHFWRYTVESSSSATGYEPFGGVVGWLGPDGASVGAGYIFPVDIIAILVFFILAELGSRFNQVVLMIAKDLAAGSTDLSSMKGALGDMFSPSSGGAGGEKSADVGARTNPDGTRTMPGGNILGEFGQTVGGVAKDFAKKSGILQGRKDGPTTP